MAWHHARCIIINQTILIIKTQQIWLNDSLWKETFYICEILISRYFQNPLSYYLEFLQLPKTDWLTWLKERHSYMILVRYFLLNILKLCLQSTSSLPWPREDRRVNIAKGFNAPPKYFFESDLTLSMPNMGKYGKDMKILQKWKSKDKQARVRVLLTLFEWSNVRPCSVGHERTAHQFSFEWSLTTDSSTLLLSIINSMCMDLDATRFMINSITWRYYSVVLIWMVTHCLTH